MQTAGANQNTAGILTIVGGAVAVLSAFLDWVDFSVEGQGTEAIKGTDLTAATMGGLVLGVVMIVMGGVLFARGARTGGRGAAITIIIVAAFSLFAAAYSAFAPEDALVQFEASDVAEESGASETEAKLFLEQGFESGQLGAKTLLGAYVGTAGAALALIGGIMGVAGARRIREGLAAAPVPTAGPGEAPPPQA